MVDWEDGMVDCDCDHGNNGGLHRRMPPGDRTVSEVEWVEWVDWVSDPSLL